MPEDEREKFRIVKGGRYGKPRRSRPRTTAEFILDRELHDAFIAIRGADGTVPSNGVYEIRQKDQHPWRILAKRFRECRDAGVPKEQVLGVLRVFAAWVEKDLYREGPSPQAA